MVEFPLRGHAFLRKLPLSTVNWSDFARPEWNRVSRPPLRFQHRFTLSSIERSASAVGLHPVERVFVRVVPSGFVRRVPDFAKVDVLLERMPLTRGWAREALLLLQRDNDGADGR